MTTLFLRVFLATVLISHIHSASGMEAVAPSIHPFKPKCAIVNCSEPCWKDIQVPGEWYSRGCGRGHHGNAVNKGLTPMCVVCTHFNQPAPRLCSKHSDKDLYSPACSRSHFNVLVELRQEEHNEQLAEEKQEKIEFFYDDRPNGGSANNIGNSTHYCFGNFFPSPIAMDFFGIPCIFPNAELATKHYWQVVRSLFILNGIQ